MSLTVTAVGYRYGLTEVLADIDLVLPRGETVALVGPSGCGKTTLLHLIAGLDRPGTGHIDNGYANPVYVFQQPRLLPWKSALDNIALGLKARGLDRAQRERRARRFGQRLGLADADLRKFPRQLSGGMQSRVALARAFVLEPDLLLLDEPFSALDVGLKAELYGQLLEELAARDASLLMITHDLMEAVRLADRILMMAPAPGRIVGEFRPGLARSLRDDGWVYRTTGEFMQAAAVRAGFGLPAAAAGGREVKPTASPGAVIEWAARAQSPAGRAHTCGQG